MIASLRNGFISGYDYRRADRTLKPAPEAVKRENRHYRGGSLDWLALLQPATSFDAQFGIAASAREASMNNFLSFRSIHPELEERESLGAEG